MLTKTERVGELLDAVVAYLETCEWSVEAVDLRPLLKDARLWAEKVKAAVQQSMQLA